MRSLMAAMIRRHNRMHHPALKMRRAWYYRFARLGIMIIFPPVRNSFITPAPSSNLINILFLYGGISMFTRLRLFLFAALCVILIGGCGDDDAGTNNPPADTNSLVATFDGQTWTSTSAHAVRAQTFNLLNISATRTTGSGLESVALTMPGVTSTGTFQIAVGQATGQITTGGVLYTMGTELGENYGEVRISQFGNGRVVGTFSMTVYQEANMANPAKQVTNGSFNIALTQ